MKELPLKQKGFFFLIYTLALVLIVFSVFNKYLIINIEDGITVIFFMLIIGLTESITLCFGGISFSTTFAVTLASYSLLGSFQCMMALIGGFLIRVLKIKENEYKHLFNTPLYGTLFNCSMLIIILSIANYMYIKSGGIIGDIDESIGQLIYLALYTF